MYSTRREIRYKRLRRAAFLPFEAKPFSRVPFKQCPYIQEMMRIRHNMFIRAKKMGTTLEQWEVQIRELYRLNGWTRTDRTGRVYADPWRFFRYYADNHKRRQPEYSSPWEKRYRNWRDFLKKIERTMQAQRGTA